MGNSRNAFTPLDWAYYLLSSKVFCIFQTLSRDYNQTGTGKIALHKDHSTALLHYYFQLFFFFFWCHISVSSTWFLKNSSSVSKFFILTKEWHKEEEKQCVNHWAEVTLEKISAFECEPKCFKKALNCCMNIPGKNMQVGGRVLNIQNM